MKKSLEMRNKLGDILDRWQAAMTVRDAENDPDKRAAAQTKVDELKSEHTRAKSELADQEALEAAQTEAAGNHLRDQDRRSGGTAGRGTDNADSARKRYSLLRAIRSVAEGKQLDGIEAEMYEEANNEARNAQVSLSGTIRIPGMLSRMEHLSNREQRADLSVGTTTAGGHTVQTTLGELIPILEPKLVTRALGADILTGLTGNLTFPRNNADSTAAWEGENADADQTDVTFDQVALTPKRLAAFTVIGKQLIVQSSIDIENLVRRRLNFAVSRAVDLAAINGSGTSNQPTGVLNTSGIGSVAIGTNGGNPTWAHIVSLETSIATGDADMGRLSYLTTPGVRGKLKVTEKASSTAQFVWTDERAGDSRMGQLNGLNAFTSTLVPSTLTKGTSSGVCHAIVFGNWEELMIAQWAGVDITLDNITLAGKAQIKLIVNSWWDIAVKHAASFAAIKDATIS